MRSVSKSLSSIASTLASVFIRTFALSFISSSIMDFPGFWIVQQGICIDKGMKDRCVLVEMNAASVEQLLPIARRVASDMNVVLNDEDLVAEIAASHGSLREVMSRVKRLARRRHQIQSQSKQSILEKPKY